MYKSLLSWLNNDISYKKFLSRNGAGEITYAKPIAVKCYIVYEVKAIKNTFGDDIISTVTVYFDGSDSTFSGLTENDAYELNGKMYTTKALSKFYDQKGSVSVLEVAL